ncbi:MAG: hypothetical protein JWQ53_2679 [Klenkia sp.]|nr:hypothetical protein [Klenkia sp.]
MTETVITVHPRDDEPGQPAVCVRADDGTVHEAGHATNPAPHTAGLVRDGRPTMAPADYLATGLPARRLSARTPGRNRPGVTAAAR